jgi:hypothetical protein
LGFYWGILGFYWGILAFIGGLIGACLLGLRQKPICFCVFLLANMGWVMGVVDMAGSLLLCRVFLSVWHSRDREII